MKKRIILLLSFVLLFFSACSSSETSDGVATELYNPASFNEEKGYSVYIKDGLNYGIYEYDINSLTKTDIGVNLPVNNSETSFLHSFLFNDYIYVISSSIYYDSFITQISASNPSEMQTIRFEDDEFITFEEDFDNIVFSNDKLYIILSKNNFLSDGHSDYITEVDFSSLTYDTLKEVPIDAFILSSYQNQIYIDAVESPVHFIYNYDVDTKEIDILKESLTLTESYVLQGDFLFTMKEANTGIKRENLLTHEILDVTLENTVKRSSLVGVYDNRVVFGYERLEEYNFYNMNLDGMALTEILLYYDNQETIPPIIIAELENDFIVKLINDMGEEEIAIIKKSDFWINRNSFSFFS